MNIGVIFCRIFYGHSGTPAQDPDCCRLIEAICIRLCDVYKSPKKGRTRWSLILDHYHKLRERVVANDRLMECTELQIVALNNTTLNKW